MGKEIKNLTFAWRSVARCVSNPFYQLLFARFFRVHFFASSSFKKLTTFSADVCVLPRTKDERFQIMSDFQKDKQKNEQRKQQNIYPCSFRNTQAPHARYKDEQHLAKSCCLLPEVSLSCSLGLSRRRTIRSLSSCSMRTHLILVKIRELISKIIAWFT